MKLRDTLNFGRYMGPIFRDVTIRAIRINQPKRVSNLNYLLNANQDFQEKFAVQLHCTQLSHLCKEFKM